MYRIYIHHRAIICSKEISRVQEEHVYFLKKLEKERRRKSFFDSEFDVRTVCYTCMTTTRLADDRLMDRWRLYR